MTDNTLSNQFAFPLKLAKSLNKTKHKTTMKTFTFDCPECGQKLEADETMQGEIIECPSCGKEIRVPSPFKPQNNRSTQANSKSAVIERAEEEDSEHEIFKMCPARRAYVGKMVGSFFWAILLSLVLFFALPDISTFGGILLGFLIVPLTYLKIWIKTHSIEYRLTNERFFVKRGIISRHIDELELFRVKDVSSSQGVFQRLLGYGNILVLSTDDTCPKIVVEGIKSPVEMKELLRKTYRAARKKEGVRSTEFIPS